MKANEICVGDWLHLHYDTISGEPVEIDFQVDQIRKVRGKEVYYVYSKEHGNMGVVENLEPIPITPEILEKNGFEKTIIYGMKATFYGFIEENEYKALTINEITEGIWKLEYINFKTSSSIIRIRVSYVHELQRVLQLCGIDKEIVL